MEVSVTAALLGGSNQNRHDPAGAAESTSAKLRTGVALLVQLRDVAENLAERVTPRVTLPAHVGARATPLLAPIELTIYRHFRRSLQRIS